MGARASSWAAFVGAAVMALGIATLAAMPAGQADRATTHFLPAVAAVALVSMAVIVWRIEPAYTLSAAIFLTPFAGNWPQLGVPGPLSPDRLLLAGGIAAVLLRAPPIADRPRLQISGAHWVLGAGRGLRARVCLRRRHARPPRPVLQARRCVRHHALPPLPGCPSGVPDAAPAQCAAHHSRGARRLPGAHRALRDPEARRPRLPEVHRRPQLRHPRPSRPRSVRRRRRQRARALHVRGRVRHRVLRVAQWLAAHARRGGRHSLLRRQLPQSRALGVDRRRPWHRRRRCSPRAPCAATSCLWRSRAPPRSPCRWH